MFLCVCLFSVNSGQVFVIGEKSNVTNPPFTEQVGGYLGCIAAVAAVALFASAHWEGEDEEESHIVRMDYNRGATVFVALLIPANKEAWSKSKK